VAQAVDAGGDVIIVGGGIITQPDPALAAKSIYEKIGGSSISG